VMTRVYQEDKKGLKAEAGFRGKKSHGEGVDWVNRKNVFCGMGIDKKEESKQKRREVKEKNPKGGIQKMFRGGKKKHGKKNKKRGGDKGGTSFNSALKEIRLRFGGGKAVKERNRDGGEGKRMSCKKRGELRVLRQEGTREAQTADLRTRDGMKTEDLRIKPEGEVNGGERTGSLA